MIRNKIYVVERKLLFLTKIKIKKEIDVINNGQKVYTHIINYMYRCYIIIIARVLILYTDKTKLELRERNRWRKCIPSNKLRGIT